MNSNETDAGNRNAAATPKHCGGRCHGRWKIPFIVAGIVLIKSALVLVFWNLLIPNLFHGPVLTYLQALELTVLAKLLVGFHGPCGKHFGRHRWHEHWAALSDEERAKLRDEIRTRCGR